MAVHKQYQWQHLKAVVWKIEENLDQEYWSALLSEADQKRFKQLKNPHKRLEFLNTRAALHHLTDGNIELSYSERGAPKLPGFQGISISHNREYSAVIVSDLFPVAIDLEAFRPQMLQLANRYLSEQETNSIMPDNEKVKCLACWSAKETLIKMEDDPGLDLRNEIRISPFPYQQTGMSRGIVRKSGNIRSYPLFFKFEKDYCLCFSYKG